MSRAGWRWAGAVKKLSIWTEAVMTILPVNTVIVKAKCNRRTDKHNGPTDGRA